MTAGDLRALEVRARLGYVPDDGRWRALWADRIAHYYKEPDLAFTGLFLMACGIYRRFDRGETDAPWNELCMQCAMIIWRSEQ